MDGAPTLPNRLRWHRNARNLSQRKVAALIGEFVDTDGELRTMSPQMVSKLEIGAIQLTPKYLELFSIAFGVPKADLLIEDSPSIGAVAPDGEPSLSDREAKAAIRLYKLNAFFQGLSSDAQDAFLAMARDWAQRRIKL